MTEKESALYSHYIIDGIRLDMTPAELLDECMEDEGFASGTGFGDILDESTEPPLSAFTYNAEKERLYRRRNYFLYYNRSRDLYARASSKEVEPHRERLKRGHVWEYLIFLKKPSLARFL